MEYQVPNRRPPMHDRSDEMLTCQFLVHCASVAVPGQRAGEALGFFATFHVRAASPRAAADRLPVAIRRRMRAHGVGMVSEGRLRTQCRIDTSWTVLDEAPDPDADTGFTFHRIGALSAMIIPLQFWWLRHFRRYSIIDL